MTRIPALDPDWTPEAVVFDCDGTLIDSEQHWQRARAIVLRAFGHAPDEEFAQRAKGLHYRDCGALMAELVGAPAGTGAPSALAGSAGPDAPAASTSSIRPSAEPTRS